MRCLKEVGLVRVCAGARRGLIYWPEMGLLSGTVMVYEPLE